MTATCSGCHLTFEGLKTAHCGSCHTTFGSVEAFDIHRGMVKSGRCNHIFLYDSCSLGGGGRVVVFSDDVDDMNAVYFEYENDCWDTPENHQRRRETVERLHGKKD